MLGMAPWHSLVLAAAPPSRAAVSPDSPALLPLRRASYSFESLAGPDALNLLGTDASTQVNFGMRLDESVASARLVLLYTLSPALLPQVSHLKVFLNGELLTTIPVAKDKAGSPQKIEIDLDPMYFIDFNQLKFQLIGHYTDQCEFPFHSSLWARIGGQSRLEFDLRQLPLKENLALLPAPFFDVRDKSAVTLPIVMVDKPAPAALKAAGVVASWFGVMADYRSVRFPVSTQGLPKRGNAVVFATADALPEGLTMAAPTAPTISVVSNPNDASGKLLVIGGRDAADLEVAATALALGQAGLSGNTVGIDALTLPGRRRAYDAPAWVDTSAPVRLGSLVTDPAGLQAEGSTLGALQTTFRLPPDLYITDNQGIPVKLKFRYTQPAEGMNGNLSLTLNDQYVDALPLQAGAGTLGLKSLSPMKLLGDGTVQDSGKLVVPTFLLAGSNDMKWRFNIPVVDSGKCSTTQRAGMLGAIDPDSTIDLTGLDHYTAMPNLALYANSGFPFTKYADLAETAVVMPDRVDAMDIEAMLVALARMGSMTALPATRFEVVYASDVGKVKNRDLLVISHGDGSDVLAGWKRDLPMTLGAARRSFAPLTRMRDMAYDWWADTRRHVPTEQQGLAILNGNGPMGAMMGFRSPADGDRNVIALAASNTEGLGNVLGALNDSGKLRAIRGDLALVRGDVVESFRIDAEYHVGSLPWWRWLAFQSGRHPVLMALAGLLAGALAAVIAFGLLRQMSDRRVGRQDV